MILVDNNNTWNNHAYAKFMQERKWLEQVLTQRLLHGCIIWVLATKHLFTKSVCTKPTTNVLLSKNFPSSCHGNIMTTDRQQQQRKGED